MTNKFVKLEPNTHPLRPDETGELMYVRCAYCQTFIDVKPGNLSDISHGLCPPCFNREMDKLKQRAPNAAAMA